MVVTLARRRREPMRMGANEKRVRNLGELVGEKKKESENNMQLSSCVKLYLHSHQVYTISHIFIFAFSLQDIR